MNNKKKIFSQIFTDGIFNVEESELRVEEKEFLSLLLKNLRWNISEGFLGDIGLAPYYSDFVKVDYKNTNYLS